MNLSFYYDKIMKEPLINKEDEFDLFLELQDEGVPESRKVEIRDRIVRANLRFVFKEAKKYSRNDPSMFEELIAAGNEGLLVGMQKYNPQSGYRFLTYAGWWVSQRILHRMGNQRIVALPIWRQQLSSRIQKVVESTEGMTFEQLKPHFPDVPEKDLRELFQTRFLTFYIEDMGEDSSFEINPIETEVNSRLDRQKIHAALAELPELPRRVLEMTYGLVDGEERKISEIIKELGINKEKVKAAREEALSLLLEKFGGVNPFSDQSL
jgi:RNA polymerase sigma factor (sigma-70 family)